MILSEPPPTQADIRFRLLGFPVRIHPMFWVITVLLGPFQQRPIYSVLWLAAVLICILLHELGHAAAMRCFGFRPWIVLHGFGGLTGYHPGDFSARRPGPWGQIFISLAGPASGFLLAAVLVAAIMAVGRGDELFFYGPASFLRVVPGIFDGTHFGMFLFYVFQVAVLWGLINLLPIFPLDGGQVAQQLFSLAVPNDAIRQSLILSVLTAGSVAAVAVLQWDDWYLAFFFGYLAYSSFTMLQVYTGRGGGW